MCTETVKLITGLIILYHVEMIAYHAEILILYRAEMIACCAEILIR